ncbi:capsid assembly scaffolding protein Gp46 family protein [Peribacillus sp. JNUCC 23]
MELKDVKEFFEHNKESDEVKEYLQGFKVVSVEDIQTLAQSDKAITSWLDSEKDKHYNKALETYKTNSLPKIIEEELAKRSGASKSPEQQKVEDALAEIARWKTKTIRGSVKNEALKFATENKLPSDIIDYFIALEKEDDEDGTKSIEATMANLAKFKDSWSNQLQTVVNERLKASGHTPKDITTPPTAENLESMSMEEYKKARSN